MRLIIAGGRDFTDRSMMSRKLSKILGGADLGFGYEYPDVVLCGGARGADTLGKEWAKRHGVEVEMYHADWNGLGRRAGYVRNEAMAINATHLIAFYDGVSKGTGHMITLARKHGVEVKIVRY